MADESPSYETVPSRPPRKRPPLTPEQQQIQDMTAENYHALLQALCVQSKNFPDGLRAVLNNILPIVKAKQEYTVVSIESDRAQEGQKEFIKMLIERLQSMSIPAFPCADEEELDKISCLLDSAKEAWYDTPQMHLSTKKNIETSKKESECRPCVIIFTKKQLFDAEDLKLFRHIKRWKDERVISGAKKHAIKVSGVDLTVGIVNRAVQQEKRKIPVVDILVLI